MLVLALENFLSSARLPKALKDAGFDVGVLCYPDSLIARTRYVDRRDLITPGDGAEAVAARMVNLVDALAPALVIPADERALRFLHHVAEVQHLGHLPRRLTELVERSLPERWAFELSQNKRSATEFAAQLGIPVPASKDVESVGDVAEFANEHGYPIVLKPHRGSGGMGMRVCRSSEELAAAPLPDGGCLVQSFVHGLAAESSGIAWQGKLLGCICYEKTIMHPADVGQSAVVTVIDHPQMVRHLASVAKATRHNGILSISWMIDEADSPLFLEINARCVPIIGPSGKLGLNLCACLYAKLVGAPLPKPDPSAPKFLALYPQELHRDPRSPYREYILDEPFDDPEVHRAMEQGIAYLAAVETV